jgi:ABC-type molybdate transport system permease subunit
MAHDHQNPMNLSVSSAVSLAVSQAAIGCGIGILLSGKLEDKKRTVAAIGIFSIALASSIPVVAGIVLELVNGPRSKLGVRRSLRSMRADSGLHAEEETF